MLNCKTIAICNQKGVDLMPSSSDLFDFEIGLVTAMNSDYIVFTVLIITNRDLRLLLLKTPLKKLILFAKTPLKKLWG